MALSCLLTKLTAPQCLFRGQTLRTTKTLILRSSAILTNKDFPQLLMSERTKKELLQNKPKLALPLSFVSKVRYASNTTPEPEHKKHSHVMVWQMERILSLALLPAIPAALFMPSQYLDTAVALMIVLHTHWGLEAIVVDYIRPILFGNVIPKVSLGLLYLFSAAMLAGLMNLIYNDFGLANTIIHIWKS